MNGKTILTLVVSGLLAVGIASTALAQSLVFDQKYTTNQWQTVHTLGFQRGDYVKVTVDWTGGDADDPGLMHADVHGHVAEASPTHPTATFE